MPWNESDRAKYASIRDRYLSDMSEAEFALIALGAISAFTTVAARIHHLTERPPIMLTSIWWHR